MTIKPIKKEIENLWDAKPNTSMGDRLDVLVTLVEAYEQKHYKVDPPDPIEAIKFRMEQLELKPSDLAKILGGRSRVSEVLNKKRKLTVEMMRSSGAFSHSGRIVIGLNTDCHLVGPEPLLRELTGLWKYKARRFRLIYKVDRKARLIRIFAIGTDARFTKNWLTDCAKLDGVDRVGYRKETRVARSATRGI